MRIGICDDEKEIQELIEEKVRKHCPEEEIVIFSSGRNYWRRSRRRILSFWTSGWMGKTELKLRQDSEEKRKSC